MSLRLKFALLLAFIGVIMAATLGMAYGFGSFLERQFLQPFRSFTVAMERLSTLKQMNGRLTRMLPGPRRDEPGFEYFLDHREAQPHSPDGEVAARYEAMFDRVELVIDDIRTIPTFDATVGSSTTRNLVDRIHEARDLAASWFETGDRDIGVRAGNAQYEIHELIERAESRLLADSRAALVYSEEMRRLYRTVVISGWVAVALVGLLGLVLMRRWISRPIDDLRRAASEIGAGNFEHRVPVRSSDELGRLSAEVNEMTSLIADLQSRAVERERLAAVGEMVRRLTHNIRNPLAGIRGLAELSRREADENDHVREQQTEIISTVDRFNRWLSELLNASSPLTVHPSSHRVAAWLEQVIATHQPLAKSKTVEIQVFVDPRVDAAEFDAHHLEHAVAGVLTNAIQVTPAGGTVRISAEPDADGCWLLSISDSGPGIPPALRDRIFEPYFTTKRDGNGIGLAVAREVVRQHRGSIRVEDAPEGGARFVLRLPAANAAATPAESSQRGQREEVPARGENTAG